VSRFPVPGAGTFDWYHPHAPSDPPRRVIGWIAEASRGLGGWWLCYRDADYWEAAWTQNLSNFDPVDDRAREILRELVTLIENETPAFPRDDSWRPKERR
jgi:hypothetical protein